MKPIDTSYLTVDHTRFASLIRDGVLTEERYREAVVAATARGIKVEEVLMHDYGIPRAVVLEALSKRYGVPYAFYDERIPVYPGYLPGLDSARLNRSLWFPISKQNGKAVIIANNPADPALQAEVKQFVKADGYEFRVGLAEDIRWFIQVFLHAPIGLLIGTERTGLAYWRNTMAHWRTRMACYRTDLATARTGLAVLRWGLGLVTISDTLLRTHPTNRFSIFIFYWVLMAFGFGLSLLGLNRYLRSRKARMKPPGNQTLVEVTSATLHFLENYHFIENAAVSGPTKRTMLGRLGDFLASHCTIIYPEPASRERTHLARERNVLAGSRTVAACYRTIYARARTGLAFIRTGATFTGISLGQLRFFSSSPLSFIDGMILLAGLLMIVDGTLWYLPVRKEQTEVPRYPLPQQP